MKHPSYSEEDFICFSAVASLEQNSGYRFFAVRIVRQVQDLNYMYAYLLYKRNTNNSRGS